MKYGKFYHAAEFLKAADRAFNDMGRASAIVLDERGYLCVKLLVEGNREVVLRFSEEDCELPISEIIRLMRETLRS